MSERKRPSAGATTTETTAATAADDAPPATSKPRLESEPSNDHNGSGSGSTSVSSNGSSSCSCINQYAGWRVPAAQAAATTAAAAAAAAAVRLDRVSFRGQESPKSFFEKYVTARRPVVITDSEGPDDKWNGGQWDLAYLRKVAGSGTVRIEHRRTDREQFGRGNHSKMLFGKFLDVVEGVAASGSGATDATRVYLTTQDLGLDEEGRPYLHSTPCTQLFRAGDFPARPAILGTLVPMNYNLWIGSTVPKQGGGSSSGLHHDFHDNLYVLLSGQKTFRLFSPADAEKMYTVGTIARVHPNGRICYQTGDDDGGKIHADGSDQQARIAMEAELNRERAEQAVAQAEADVAAGKPGAQEALDAAEEQLDEALQQAMFAEFGGEDRDDGDSDEDSSEADANHQASAHGASSSEATTELKPTTTPLHFSRVNLSESPEAISAKFPKFAEALEATVTLRAGEMLYLPAGWFHEVTSESVAGDGEYHMAFNYWFHPPDAPHYESPYTSSFWTWDWQKRMDAGCDGGPPESEL